MKKTQARKQTPAGLLAVPAELVERRIRVIRGHKVLLDSDLSDLYGVLTGNLNLAVRRNQERFPPDFMFQLTPEEHDFLVLQSAIAKPDGRRGGRRTLPYAFTQEGVAMLSSVLNSERAVQVNIAVMRVFVKMREIMAANQELAQKIEALEQQYEDHDAEIKVIFEALRQLLDPPATPKRPIGFHATAASGAN